MGFGFAVGHSERACFAVALSLDLVSVKNTLSVAQPIIMQVADFV
jgi:hypothetical protein